MRSQWLHHALCLGIDLDYRQTSPTESWNHSMWRKFPLQCRRLEAEPAADAALDRPKFLLDRVVEIGFSDRGDLQRKRPVMLY
jgi:hypothetical protein